MIQREGPGWRLARDTSREPFSVLLGGSNWALELTECEWKDFSAVVFALADQHRNLLDQLMEEESIELQMERGAWWSCLDGDRRGWSLTVVLSGDGRGAELHWPQPAAESLVAAMRMLLDSSKDQQS